MQGLRNARCLVRSYLSRRSTPEWRINTTCRKTNNNCASIISCGPSPNYCCSYVAGWSLLLVQEMATMTTMTDFSYSVDYCGDARFGHDIWYLYTYRFSIIDWKLTMTDSVVGFQLSTRAHIPRLMLVNAREWPTIDFVLQNYGRPDGNLSVIRCNPFGNGGVPFARPFCPPSYKC
jgi:hypothetical protein